ncbi:hypothetical protein [Streptomyces sp. TLI_171]|uniref:hypothetical protein n=1 Tax=Streptomyces sp. TLI_171 TaxID=1938859 RepID=UPI000C188270|nr:hypothetical protein [Streptomyces sp. TLI_171]RKE22162.1 hypothetical protein BX266_5596 [Streptomyces sp. TLI_171]
MQNIRVFRRLVSAAGVCAVAASVLSVATPIASAADSSQCDSRSHVEYSIDNGQSWTRQKGLTQAAPPASFTVRLTAQAAAGCSYPVSLASYRTQGDKWETSGQQTLVDWVTVTLTKASPQATLKVKSAAPACFGQLDLYGNAVKYDGSQGPLPHYPDADYPKDHITWWIGGKACTTASPSPSHAPTPVNSSPTPSSPPSPSPSATKSPTPTPTPSRPSLAETGVNGRGSAALALGALAVVVLGLTLVLVTRRARRVRR